MSKNRSTFIDTQRVKAWYQNPPSSSAVSICHSTKQLKQQTVHTKPLTKVEIYCSLACKFNALLFDRKAASNEDPLSFLCYHSMKLKSRHSELPILTFYQFPSTWTYLDMTSNLTLFLTYGVYLLYTVKLLKLNCNWGLLISRLVE